jgi:IS30 family transposase
VGRRKLARGRGPSRARGLGRARGGPIRCIARRLGRSAAPVSRELARNADRRGSYRATTAQALAYERVGRPKPAKLAHNPALRAKVEAHLAQRYSPEQIAGRLRVEFPDNPQMRVSTETIYWSLYVQSRGALRRDLAKCLRTGRALRQPGRKAGERKNRIPDTINSSQRPAEANDRAVPATGKATCWSASAAHGDRRSGGALDGLRDARLPVRGLQARAGRARAGQEDPDAP